MESEANPWQLADFDAFVRAPECARFKAQLTQDNAIVMKELHDIMAVAHRKLSKLDKAAGQRMENMLNLNLDADIRDSVFVYLYSQIYSRVRGNTSAVREGRKDKFTEVQWTQLQFKI